MFLKELPRRFVLAKGFLIFGSKFERAVFKRINAGAFGIAARISLEPGRMHSSRFLQTFDVVHIDVTPDAPRLSRREALHIACVIQVPAHAVDPAKAERLVERFCISDALLAGRFLVETDQQLGSAIVVSLKPLAKLFG